MTTDKDGHTINTHDVLHPSSLIDNEDLALDVAGLAGHVLLALPHMAQPLFKKTVILICQHNDEGAVGVILNHVIEGVRLDHVTDNEGSAVGNAPKTWSQRLTKGQLFWGGPHHVRQGLLVHSVDRVWPNTIRINESLAITSHEDLADPEGESVDWPQHLRFFLGHVHWKPGQLEKDWLHQPWLSFPQQSSDILDHDPETHWESLFKQHALHLDHWSQQRCGTGI